LNQLSSQNLRSRVRVWIFNIAHAQTDARICYRQETLNVNNTYSKSIFRGVCNYETYVKIEGKDIGLIVQKLAKLAVDSPEICVWDYNILDAGWVSLNDR